MPDYKYKCKECITVVMVHQTMDEAREGGLCCELCGNPLTRVFLPIRINSRQPIAGHGMEIYTNERDATDQMFEQIQITDD